MKVAVAAEQLEGTILGLEKKPKAVGDKGQIEVWVLNLMTDATLRSVELDSVQKIELQDPQLQEELKKALLALSQARDQDKKPVTINFTGQGERHVRLGYVVETPIWKTSYRLILGGGDGAGDATEANGEGQSLLSLMPDIAAVLRQHRADRAANWPRRTSISRSTRPPPAELWD